VELYSVLYLALICATARHPARGHHYLKISKSFIIIIQGVKLKKHLFPSPCLGPARLDEDLVTNCLVAHLASNASHSDNLLVSAFQDDHWFSRNKL
jgi:hypothetical protein